MLTVVILGFSCVAGGSAAQARPVAQASIEELVRTYRSGRHEEAVSPATRWSAERITLEIGRLLAEDARPHKAEEREVTRLAAVAILAESAVIHVRKGDPGLRPPLGSSPGAELNRSARVFLRAPFLSWPAVHWHVDSPLVTGCSSRHFRTSPMIPSC
jgi:hypothetical protein